jgi:hypothetical protein
MLEFACQEDHLTILVDRFDWFVLSLLVFGYLFGARILHFRTFLYNLLVEYVGAISVCVPNLDWCFVMLKDCWFLVRVVQSYRGARQVRSVLQEGIRIPWSRRRVEQLAFQLSPVKFTARFQCHCLFRRAINFIFFNYEIITQLRIPTLPIFFQFKYHRRQIKTQ